MGEWFTRVPRVREVKNSKLRPGFATAKTSMLSWRYVAEIGTANSLHVSA